MFNSLSKLKIQVNLLKLLNDPSKPSSAVSKGSRCYHLHLINRSRRKVVSNAPVMQSNGSLPGVVGRFKSTNYFPLRRVSSASSYFDYVDAEAVKDEIKDKIYKLLFPNKMVNMVDYFRKRKEDKGPSVREQPVSVPKTKPAQKSVKPTLKPTPSRKNYASFIASSQHKVLLPKVVNVNGVEVINGKIVLDKLEKQKELIKKEEDEAQRILGNKKLSSREYVYLLNKRHRLASIKPNRIAVNLKSVKAPVKKEAVEKETGRTAPPRKDYSLFLTRKAPHVTSNYSLHGIELFKGSSMLVNQKEALNSKPDDKVFYFEHYDNKVAVKIPKESKEGRLGLRPTPPTPTPTPQAQKQDNDPLAEIKRRRQNEFF